MEILEHGELTETYQFKIFKCTECGCKFKADNTEYEYANRYENYYYCECPHCLNIAYEACTVPVFDNIGAPIEC